ncbi:hypothetical protein PR202_gb08913 [Eleusine coracana subsp. coracana]|uniref:Uncharacterized protein ycf23 n=1 Tax=Eleusine coracana subsp. coracana TaxID=191504 RepID=A0AAV5EG42_ELECO|nr:hypothetical protein PR202_gb08913 [Eleusine coracana subsp. coracana]
MAAPASPGLLQAPSFCAARRLPAVSRSATRRASFTVQASASDSTKHTVLEAFRENRALKIISGLQNFDRSNVASVVTAADKVEIGNYDSFYEMGIEFSSEQILNMTRETRKMLPDITLSVTVPHTLSLPDQMRLAELLEEEGADIIQTEGGKCSRPTKPGVLGLIEKATPTLAAAYSISRAVSIPVMCSSGLSSVTAPMAVTAGAAGVGVGSAVNKLNDVVAMIAEVRSIAQAMGLPSRNVSEHLRSVHH